MFLWFNFLYQDIFWNSIFLQNTFLVVAAPKWCWPCGGLWAVLFGDPKRLKITSFVFRIFHPLISYPCLFIATHFEKHSFPLVHLTVSENIICTRAARRLQLLKKEMYQILSVKIASKMCLSETTTNTLSLPFYLLLNMGFQSRQCNPWDSNPRIQPKPLSFFDCSCFETNSPVFIIVQTQTRQS